jgi:hypothetical protein
MAPATRFDLLELNGVDLRSQPLGERKAKLARLLAQSSPSTSTRMDGNVPCFFLTFGDASRPPVGAVILEAPSMHHARMTAVVRRLAPGVPFGEGLQLSARMMTLSPTQIGRMMSGAEAAELILQLVEGRRRPKR